ncbi:hypothetical protein [Microbacterium sp.]
MTDAQTRIIVTPSLTELIEEFATVLDAPAGLGVADTDAKIAVLGNVRAAFVNQRQIPIPSDTSAARGAFIALQKAAERIAVLQLKIDADVVPSDDHRIVVETDDQGNLNPMRLFDEDDDLTFGLYPFASLVPALTGVIDDAMLQVPQSDAVALVELEKAVSWETWMASFAR